MVISRSFLFSEAEADERRKSRRLGILSLLAARLLRLLLLLGDLTRLPSALLVRASLSGGRCGHRGNRFVARSSGLALPAGGLLGRLGLILDVGDDGGSGNLLELLGNGILVVGCSLGSLFGLRVGDGEAISVVASLIICHVLGRYVASLVRVDTSVIETQVPLVGVVPGLWPLVF